MNDFKQNLGVDFPPQIGLWMSMIGADSAEICAGAGFDWLVIDSEHAPHDLASVLAQLRALAAYPETHAVGRVPSGHGRYGEAMIKRFLDLGVQTLLVPMIETAQEARDAARFARYPSLDDPGGVRGVAPARAAGWGRKRDFLSASNDEVCLLVQVETSRGIEHLDEIVAVDGVDGVFLGPADLSASLGHIGDHRHPEVLRVMRSALQRVTAAGKPAGTLVGDPAEAAEWLELGARFVAVGADAALLVGATDALVAAGRAAATATSRAGRPRPPATREERR